MKTSEDVPMVLEAKLDKTSFKELIEKLKLAGVKIPKEKLAKLATIGRDDVVVSVGIPKSLYDGIIDIAVGYTMMVRGGIDLQESANHGEIETPIIKFNGVQVF